MEFLVVMGVWAGLCFWLAKRKGFNAAGWAVIGLLLGPIGLLVLAIKKKDYTPFPEGVRNLQYFAENVTSKIKNTLK